MALFFHHKQTVPASTWAITHNLGHTPVGDVMISVDGVLEKMLPLNVEHQDDNTVIITFSTPETGEARMY